MPHIFISYSSNDRPVAQTLAEALHGQGWTVWWDRKIPVGKSFSQVIEEAIDSAQCVVVIWTENSVNSDWVRNEAEEGKRRNILVPVRLGEVRIPLGFRHLQAADLQGWQPGVAHAEYESLLESIRAAFAESTANSDRKKPEPQQSKRPPENLRSDPPLYSGKETLDRKPDAVRDHSERDLQSAGGTVKKKSSRNAWIAAGVAAAVVVGAIVGNIPEDDYDSPAPAPNYVDAEPAVGAPPSNPDLSSTANASAPPAPATASNNSLSLQWQDHAVRFTGTLRHNGGVQGQVRATLHDLRTGQQLSEETFPVQLASVGAGQYLISGEVVIPNGDSTTHGRHTHSVYIQAQQYPNGSWVAQNCTAQGCFNAAVQSAGQ